MTRKTRRKTARRPSKDVPRRRQSRAGTPSEAQVTRAAEKLAAKILASVLPVIFEELRREARAQADERGRP